MARPPQIRCQNATKASPKGKEGVKESGVKMFTSRLAPSEISHEVKSGEATYKLLFGWISVDRRYFYLK